MIPDKNTFCMAPFTSIFLDSDNKLYPCCVYYGKSNYSFDKINDYVGSTELNSLKKDLINGIQHKGCRTCWNDESIGNDSLRLIMNRTLTPEYKGKIEQLLSTNKVSNIKKFHLNLGNLCNLKCLMCGPNLSSQLLAEVNTNQQLKNVYKKGDYKQETYNWPKQNNFVEWCEKHLPNAININFTGGEPFINPWISKVLKEIPDEQKSKCILHFTSNLTIFDEDLFKNIFPKFKEVWLSVSVEGTDKTFEYIRYGHSWEKLLKNVNLIKDMKINNLKLNINYVLQSISYHSIINLVNVFDDLKIEIRPIFLITPNYLHISSLTKVTKEKFIKETSEYKGLNSKFINVVRNITKQNIEQDHTLATKCKEHLQKFDNVRKNSYKNIIPIENF
jgi:MoaA/NifB/PqqE/SkfB family radical SAM enzyme